MNENLPDYLTLPLLQSEVDPTQTDFRQIQRWALGVPRLVYTPAVGKQPPANIEPLMTTGSIVGAPSGGLLPIPLTGYSFGYLPMVCPGDSANIGFCTVYLTTSTIHTLVVLCYTPSGSFVSGVNVRVNYQVIGA